MINAIDTPDAKVVNTNEDTDINANTTRSSLTSNVTEDITGLKVERYGVDDNNDPAPENVSTSNIVQNDP